MYRSGSLIRSVYGTIPGRLWTPRSEPNVRHLSQASTSEQHLSHSVQLPSPSLVIVGSAAIDIQSRSPTKLFPRSTTPGSIFISPGGVARNMAEAAQALLPPQSVKLVYPAAKDSLGRLLDLEMQAAGLRTDGLIESQQGSSTAACSLMLDCNGDLTGGVSDMKIVEELRPESMAALIKTHGGSHPQMLLFDCNLTSKTIQELIRVGAEDNIPIFCEPTSAPKLSRALAAIRRSGIRINHITPNTLELAIMASDMKAEAGSMVGDRGNIASRLSQELQEEADRWTEDPYKRWIRDEKVFENALTAAIICDTFWVKHGDKGLVRIGLGKVKEGELSLEIETDLYLNCAFHPPIPIPDGEIVSTTGAGDTLAGSIAAELIKGTPERLAVKLAMQAVDRTLRSRRAVD